MPSSSSFPKSRAILGNKLWSNLSVCGSLATKYCSKEPTSCRRKPELCQGPSFMEYGIVVNKTASQAPACKRPNLSVFQNRWGGSMSKSMEMDHVGCCKKEVPLGPVLIWSAATKQALKGPPATKPSASLNCGWSKVKDVSLEQNCSQPAPVHTQRAWSSAWSHL